MVFQIIIFIVGLLILIKCADLLVDGASSISIKLKIPQVVIGLTVIAFGTSAPELLVTTTSAINGNTDAALGNVIGSNIANILVILGLSAIIYSINVHKTIVYKDMPYSFVGIFLILILGSISLITLYEYNFSQFLVNPVFGMLTGLTGVVFLVFFSFYIFQTYQLAKKNIDEDLGLKPHSNLKSITFISLGLIGLIIGSRFAVDAAINLARLFSLSEAFIGLSLLAFGTSLPELVTSVRAAMRKNPDLAVGNIIGSNIFNIFFILGITSLIKPIPLPRDMLFDIFILIIATLLMFASVFLGRKFQIGRIKGSAMILFYLVYLIIILYRG